MRPNNDDIATGTTVTTTDLEKLKQECPGSTPAERKRFLEARDRNCEKTLVQLQAYLAWRTEHRLDDSYHCSLAMPPLIRCDDDNNNNNNNNNNEDDPTLECSSSNNDDDDKHECDDTASNTEIWHSCASDEEDLDHLDWRFASQTALWYEQRTKASTEDSKCSWNPPSGRTTTALPQLARILSPQFRDQQGHRILQLLPAQMDLSRASDTVFALSIALYLERKLNRESPEKLMVAIDVRGGIGWTNPKPQKLLPFVRQLNALLEQHFPERMARCLVFPLPASATILWGMITVFLDPMTAQKINVVRGDSGTNAPTPLDRMEKHIPLHAIEQMEYHRCSSFVKTVGSTFRVQ